MQLGGEAGPPGALDQRVRHRGNSVNKNTCRQPSQHPLAMGSKCGSQPEPQSIGSKGHDNKNDGENGQKKVFHSPANQQRCALSIPARLVAKAGKRTPVTEPDINVSLPTRSKGVV